MTLKNPESSLIVKRNGLEDLEVLMLEANPYETPDINKMKEVLDDWFKDTLPIYRVQSLKNIYHLSFGVSAQDNPCQTRAMSSGDLTRNDAVCVSALSFHFHFWTPDQSTLPDRRNRLRSESV